MRLGELIAIGVVALALAGRRAEAGEAGVAAGAAGHTPKPATHPGVVEVGGPPVPPVLANLVAIRIAREMGKPPWSPEVRRRAYETLRKAYGEGKAILIGAGGRVYFVERRKLAEVHGGWW